MMALSKYGGRLVGQKKEKVEGNVKKDFGGGYRKPKKDEDGILQCHCVNPKPFSWDGGTFRCMKCMANWYH